MAISFNNSNNITDSASFSLLRTNPKFTSNVKLVVDKSEKLYLSAFKANKSLSRIEFQKYEVRSNGTYANDVSRFYKGLPLNECYQTLRKRSDLTPYTEYSAQYEDQYHFGASFNTTKLYDEQYKFLAPIWLNKKIPSHFVIWRVEDVDYNQNYDDSINSQNERILKLLKNATIIKSYDLKRGSNLGEYLHNHVYNEGFPDSPLTINFDTNTRSTYNGIDILKGGFVNKKVDLTKDYLTIDQPEILANQYLTSNFEKNGIISANVINLEFLFDDESATNYKIYRYFGLYVDSYDEGEFNIDTINKNDLIYITPDSYKSYYDLKGTNLTDEDMLPNVDDLKLPTLNYIKDKNNKFYHLTNNVNFNALKLPSSINNSKDLFTGFAKIDNTVEISPTKPKTRGFIKLKIINTPAQNDRIFIADKTELKISKYNLGDYMILADPTLPATVSEPGKFSSAGTLQQIAIALSSAINQLEILSYKTFVSNNSVIIEDTSAGLNRKRTGLGIFKNNLINFIKIESGLQDDLGLTKIENGNIVNSDVVESFIESNYNFGEWSIFTPIGGGNEDSVFLVNKNELGTVAVGEYIKQRGLNKYTEIKQVVQDPFNTDLFRVICNRAIKPSEDNLIQIYNLYKTKHGKFSAYNLKDFDFDFYSTKMSDIGELNYENASIINPSLYFKNLTDILKSETDVNDNIENKILLSEYDRLGENELKETAIRSRVVPTIMKFALKNANNARNLPYMLSVNEAFGSDNISPNINLTPGRDVELLNMEHLHIAKVPEIYEENLTNLSSHPSINNDFQISVDLLKSTVVDYFSIYFGWNGIYDSGDQVWIDDKFNKLYSIFDTDSKGFNSSTIFRGLRYIYKKRKELNKQQPTEFITTSEVNNYKFGSVLKYNNNQTSNSVDYQVVKNDIHKFICVVITINIVENDIESLSRYDLYNLKNIEFDENIVDTPIPFIIKLGLAPDNSQIIYENNKKKSVFASEFAILDGTAKFTDYIKPNSEGEYSWLLFDTINETYGLKVISVIDDTEIKVLGSPIKFNNNEPDFSDNPLGDTIDVPIDANFRYWRGGEDGFTNLLDKIVAYNYVNKFNRFEDVQYITIKKDGVVSTKPEFCLEIQDGTELIKASMTTKSTDPDRPKSYQLTGKEIGKIITLRKDGGYFVRLRRMNGNYMPLFRDVITFSDIYTNQKINLPEFDTLNIDNVQSEKEFLIYNKFKNLGIAFESYKINSNTLNGFGLIENQFYHKVNDENSRNLLRLSQTTDKLPLYPAIGEIAIDRRNINVLKSKYNETYFTKNLPGGGSKFVHGTLSPIEVKSYMASTIMKVKDEYNLTSFNQQLENSLEELNNIRLNKLNEVGIHWFETDAQIFADFYLPNSIVNELLEDNIKSKFRKYIEPENSFGLKDSIDDDLKEYIINNIVNRFIIDNIEIYGIEGKNINTEFISIDSPDDLKNDGYVIQTNFETQQYQNEQLSFRLIYNKKLGYYYKLKVWVKIQA